MVQHKSPTRWIDRLFQGFLHLCHKTCTRHSWTSIILAVFLALVGWYLYIFHLEIISDRNQLLDQRIESNRDRQQFREEFGDDKYLILTVCEPSFLENSGNGAIPSLAKRLEMKRIASLWAEELRSRPDLFPRVVEKINWKEFNKLASLYLPYKDLSAATEALAQPLDSLGEFAKSPSLESLLEKANALTNQMNSSLDQGQEEVLASLIDFLESALENFNRTLDGTQTSGPQESDPQEFLGSREKLESFTEELVFRLSDGKFDSDGYLFFDGGRVLVVYSTVHGDSSRTNQFKEAMTYARAKLEQILAISSSESEVTAGLTGFPALEFEEMEAGLSDFARGTIIAIILVSCLFMIAFNNLIRPFLAAICLVISLGITFGMTWLVIGHLNLVAMVFAVILIALGIDFAIHFVTHYERALLSGKPPSEAISMTYTRMGGALWMGGLTTAAAFLSAFFTDFIGLSELGLISGLGLIICLICMCIVYPSMLFISDSVNGNALNGKLSRLNRTNLPLYRISHPVLYSTILGVTLILVIIGYTFGQYSFDTNLLNLQATDGEASRWQKLLMSTEDIATFAIALYKDKDSLLKAENKLRSSTALVRRTESLFPDKIEEKRTLLSPLCSSVQNISIKPNGSSDPFNTRRQLWNLRQKVRRFKSSGKQAELALSGLASSLDKSYNGLRNLEDATARKKLVHIDQKIRNLLEEHLPELQNFLCPPEFLPELLPDSMRSRFVGSNGSLALYIYPRQNVWNREELNIFVEQARDIEPRLFGEVISFYENGGALIRSFLQAALYSLVTILVMLILWSKSIRLTCIAVSPLIASAGLLLGLMRWNPWPIQWNYANFFALPILIGICVDSGIHLVRAWRDQNAAVFKGAMKAVLISSLTTIIGFGILATSTHQGVRSLGFILLIGITLSLLYSLILLPTVLHLFYGGKKSE